MLRGKYEELTIVLQFSRDFPFQLLIRLYPAIFHACAGCRSLALGKRLDVRLALCYALKWSPFINCINRE